jgi:hypothetical protein
MNFEDFNTLVLLVGTNPLPNFVTAEYFLTTNTSLKTIILIHSEDNQKQSSTKKYADNLQELLKSRHGVAIEKVYLSDVSNAERIFFNLREQLEDIIVPNSSVHFNYTGGTKMMSVQVYIWLKRYAENNGIPISFSHLDARNFCIVSDSGEISEDLREKVSLSIDEIIKLHGFERKNDSQNNIFKNAVEKFKEMIKGNRVNDYFDSYKGFFRDEKDDLIIKTNKMREKIQKLEEIKIQGAFLEIIKSLPEDYRPFNDDGSFNSQIDNKRFEKAVKFLDGKWLECFVYDLLNEKKGNESKITVDMDWEIEKKSYDYDNGFQIDVVLVKGYQLIGISCTTSDKKALCKGKGLEIFMRTKQIAGEESRAILITRLKEAEKIKVQQELEIETGGKNNILVLGAENFKNDNLITQIEDFIE